MARNLHRLLAAVALLATAGCAGTGDPENALGQRQGAVDRGLRTGQAALAQRDYPEAAKHFRRVLEVVPEHAEARLGLAESFLGQGAIGEAIETFDQVDEAPTTRAAARQGLGIARLIAGETEAAHEILVQVTAEDPSKWRAWNALARCYDLEGAWDRSAEAYERALESAPEPSLIHNNWGVSLMAQAEHAAAEQRFLRALELEPALAKARANLRLALAHQGRYAEALSGLNQDELAQTLNNVGYVALMRGDFGHAEAYFLRALETSPSFYEPAAQNLQLLGSMKQIATGT
jgi:Tfp pilus assembly protein PilF